MKKATVCKVLSMVIVCLLIVTSTAFAWDAHPLVPPEDEVSGALDYLKAHQNADGSVTDFGQTPWVVMAIAAANDDANRWSSGANSVMDYLVANASTATTANEYSNIILAALAGFQDPTDFGGYDFVSLLEGQVSGTQIGSSNALNDDAWGIMALIAAGKLQADPVIVNSCNFIKHHQNPDGGWGWNATAASDADSTAAPIMALMAAGENPAGTPIQNALAYLKTQQMANGGFDSWGSTNADTDAWVISALVAAGEDPTSAAWQVGGNSPIDDLINHQAVNGSYEWQPGNPGWMPMKTTACSIIALLGESYPVPTPKRSMVTTRIEGVAGTIWSGETTVLGSEIIDNTSTSHWTPDPTVLGTLVEAANNGSFTYSLTDWGGGPGGLFVDSINGIGGVTSWWLYRVDSFSPPLGAGAFELDVTDPPTPPHTEVVWYESITFAEQPLKLELDKTEILAAGSCTATVSLYNDGSATWSPLPDAIVYAGTEFHTGIDGTVSFTVNHATTLDIYAEKDGCIRSNSVALEVLWTPRIYDTNANEVIDFGEMVDALMDYLTAELTYAHMIDVLMEYLTS